MNNNPVADSLSRSAPSDGGLKQQLLWMMLLRVILYTLILGISLVLQDDKFEAITVPLNLLILFTLGVYLCTIGSAIYLLQFDTTIRKFGFIQSLLDTVFCSLLVYLSGGSQSVFTSIYFFPIITYGLLIPIKGGLIAAAASTLLYGVILVFEHSHYMPEYLLYFKSVGTQGLQASVNQFAIKGLTFFLAAVVSSLVGSRLKTTAEALTSTKQDLDRLSQLYKEIFDNITTGIITVDEEGIITSANNATVSITGMSHSDIIGKKFFSLFPLIDLTNPSPRNACDFERSDNQKIRLGYAHTALKHPSRDGGSISSDYEDTTIVTLKDISEIERLESQIRQAEKLAAIGMMSAGIAHDFRNPLTAISGSAQILAQEYSTGDPSQLQNYELTKIILRESERLIKTIADFLKFARPDTVDREWFQLAPYLQEILEVCKADPKWPATCDVLITMDPRFSIWADEQQIFTVINHLIQNGRAFCKPGNEQIRITAENRIGPGNTEMSYISVCDNGPGIDPAQSRQIFEPFFTTRPDGTGLGLAIVKQIVDSHNGHIMADNDEDGGARLCVYLPLPSET